MDSKNNFKHNILDSWLIEKGVVIYLILHFSERIKKKKNNFRTQLKMLSFYVPKILFSTPMLKL